jgi:PAS domain S-box-containing protein
MSKEHVRVLILEGRPAVAALAIRELEAQGIAFTPKCVASKNEFLAGLGDWGPDLILADHSVPGYDGLEALAAARKERPEAPFIFLSGFPDEEPANKALHQGVTDYVPKDRLRRLGPAVRRALREVEERAGRQQMEQALRNSEQRWRFLFEYAPDAYFLSDLQGTFVDCNKAAQDLIGYGRQDLTGRSFVQLNLLVGDGPARVEEQLAKNNRGEAGGPEEFTLRRKDQSEVAVEVRTYPVEPMLVLCIARDLAAWKQTENAQIETRVLRKAILDNIPDPAWLKDTQGRFLVCNEPLRRLYGRAMSEIIGKTVFDLVPAVAERLNGEDQQAISTRKSIRVERPISDAEGQTRWFDTFKAPIFNRSGKVTGTVGISRDITDRRQSQQHIHELNVLLRAIRDINKLLVQERDPGELLARACQILVQTRDYPLVWVGVRDPSSKRVLPTARAGRRHDYLDAITVTWDEALTGQGPTGSAMRSGQPCVIHDTATDPRYAPWREAGLAYGFASVAAVPMLQAGKVLGVVSVCSDCKGAFQEDEVVLLMELAGDLAFALQSIEHERERRRAELRVSAFADVGQRLSAAKTAREAAEIIVAVADQLLGLDACTLDLYSPETDRLQYVLNQDTIWGKRVDCPSAYHGKPLSPRLRDAIGKGGQLILKEDPRVMFADGTPFGDTSRPSASVLIVPIRDGPKVAGVLSIHSYTPKAYDQQSLDALQALADHCGGALQRISAQEALTDSESNYRSLVELSPEAIFIHRSREFIYANPAALKLLRAENPAQVLGRSVFDIVPPDDRDTIRHRIQDTPAGGAAPLVEQKILRLDGTPVEVESTSYPVTYKGKPAVQTIMRDITARKILELQLRQSQKMEAVGQLAGGVAHDFNNLLAVIRGHADLLLMRPGQLSPDATLGLKQIVAASERAASLTRQLLIFSRKQMMQSRPVVLNDVIAELTQMLRRIIGEHIDLQCRFTGQLPPVQADVGMIEQALVNLTVNARDAMPRGGQLLIVTEIVRFDEAQARKLPEGRAGKFVRLTVTDTGTGIAPEHLAHIFEPFFTTKEPGKGTGLGLATVHGIVKLHHGWITVSSQLGVGTTFNIFLPVTPAPARRPETPQPELVPPRGNETILLVEDDVAVRMVTRLVLEGHGYQVCEANSAPEALELWPSREKDVALLLSDIIMPGGISGRELAEQLCARKPSLRVVLMSGYSADVIGKDTAFYSNTTTQFLKKPCPANVLLETVRRCLDGNSGVNRTVLG